MNIDMKLIVDFIKHIKTVSIDRMSDADLTDDEMCQISNELKEFKKHCLNDQNLKEDFKNSLNMINFEYEKIKKDNFLGLLKIFLLGVGKDDNLLGDGGYDNSKQQEEKFRLVEQLNNDLKKLVYGKKDSDIFLK